MCCLNSILKVKKKKHPPPPPPIPFDSDHPYWCSSATGLNRNRVDGQKQRVEPSTSHAFKSLWDDSLSRMFNSLQFFPLIFFLTWSPIVYYNWHGTRVIGLNEAAARQHLLNRKDEFNYLVAPVSRCFLIFLHFPLLTMFSTPQALFSSAWHVAMPRAHVALKMEIRVFFWFYGKKKCFVGRNEKPDMNQGSFSSIVSKYCFCAFPTFSKNEKI